jgi:hypothetical protein
MEGAIERVSDCLIAIHVRRYDMSAVLLNHLLNGSKREGSGTLQRIDLQITR